MSNYSKERNFIIINLDGVAGAYRLDINTGIYYGIRGKPIKTCPRACDIRRVFYNASGNVAQLLYWMFNSTKTEKYPEMVKALQAADKIDALGIVSLGLSVASYEFIGDNFKNFVAYVRELQEGESFSFREFQQRVGFEKAKKEYGSALDQLNCEMYTTLKHNYPEISKEEIAASAYYLVRGKYWDYHRGDVDYLVDYFRMCKVMDKTPEKVNNFMREFCETKKLYELRKTEYDNKRMALNYAKQEKAWQFEYGNHIVIIPTSAQDIITEGEQMHHCVGSYVNSVVNNTTYICFIRHKDSPDTPYITCQVHTDGRIGQYFLAYDRYIYLEEDRAFQSAFRDYLRSVWIQ